jgi:hypothetical protein
MDGAVCAGRFKARQIKAAATKVRLFNTEGLLFMAIGSPSWKLELAPYHGTNPMDADYKR